MSLITRCPACGTMFKVVPDQLRISDGWVRCGHCSDVFDARAHMHSGAAAVTEPAALAAQEAAREPSRTSKAVTDSRIDSRIDSRYDSRPASQPFGSSVMTEIGASSLPPGVPDSVQMREEARSLEEGPLDRPFVLDPVDVQESPRRGAADSSVDSAYDSVAPAALQDLSFIRQARRKAFWASTPVRVAASFVVLLLVVLLAAQYAVQERDRIAAIEPRAKPLLAALCEPLHCRIGALRQIESVAIDTSSFNKVRGDLYRLNVTVRNQAPTDLQMPMIELTLTDAQDQAVIRRVLSPLEMQPRRAVLLAGGDWTGSVALAVAGSGPGARISGYRVLAFYP